MQQLCFFGKKRDVHELGELRPCALDHLNKALSVLASNISCLCMRGDSSFGETF